MRSIYAKVLIIKAVVLSAMLCASLPVKAFNTIERYQNQLQGAIKKGDVLTVKDEKFESPDFDWNKIHNASVNNLIKFGLYRETGVVLDKAFSCEIDLKVEYWPTPNQDPIVLDEHLKLKIGYNLTPGTPYQDAATHSFMSGYRVRITVNDITSAELGTDLPAAFQLNSQVIVERSYDLDAAAKLAPRIIWPDQQQTVTSPEVPLIWNKITGAEEYDLEWTFIDELSDNGKALNQTGTATSPEVLKKMFRNNATRVTVQREDYKISLVHFSKYLILRMRTVRYDKDIRLEDPWQYDLKIDENNTVRAVITLQNEWHQNNLNWQYDAVYTEDGKKKEVVNYLDGTLRNRQTVTVNNADKKAVVQETLYDEFGRPLATILPSPENESILKYYPGLHKKDATTNYTFRDIYGDAGNCIGTPKPLSTLTGAGRYYSPNNQFKSLSVENKYIPDAEGYPFAVTRYTPDNTNRVSVKGGVGKLFQPGVDLTVSKATRQYYSEPQSWELNRMFGNDVGFADHYLKNMVIDGNGQINITYLNAEGKVIATALAGETPDNVDPLPSKPVTKDITEVVLEPAQFRFDESKLKIYATGTHTQTVPGPVRLYYNIDKLIKTYAENGVTICSNCYYEMDVLITDDCNRVLYKTTESLPVGSTIGDCNNAGAATGEINANFDLVGVYYVNFELRLTEEALLSYTEDFIRKNTNLRSEWSFVYDALLGKDFLSCFNDCATCKASLGDLTTFTSRVKAQLTANGVNVAANDQKITDWINDLYASLASQCTALRASCVTSPCTELENVMKQDVSPGGQYALFDAAGSPLEADINVLALNWRKTGRFPILGSNDPLYIEERIELADGTFTSPYDGSFTLANLVQYWKPEWAARFLPDHPEYCALQFCYDNAAYLQWDERAKMLGETIADIPEAVPGGVYSESDPVWLVNKDPFFLEGGKGHGYYNDIVADLNNYTRTQPYLQAAGFSAKTLPQYISFMLYCSNKDGNTNATPSQDTWNNCTRVESCRERELEWAMFRDKYFELKEKYYTALRNTNQYCGSKCAVGTPVSFPGDCIDRSQFVIEAGTEERPDGTIQYKISYTGITLPKAVSIGIYYPAEYSSVFPAPTVQMAAGQSSAVFYVWKNVPAAYVRVGSTDCPVAPSGDPVFKCKPFDVLKNDFSRSVFNDESTQKASILVDYNGTPLLPGMFITAILYRTVDGSEVSTETITASSTQTRWTFNDVSGPVSATRIEVISCDDIPNTPPTPTCNPAYATKISRAGSSAYKTPAVSTNPAELTATAAAQQAMMINANCEAQADNWMQQMEECLAQAIHCSDPDDLEHCTRRNLLRAKLIEVCKLGGDLDHPMGASTLPSGKATAEGYKSFDEVVSGVLGVSASDLKCNSYLLDAPAPYETKQQLTSVTISGTNAVVCAKLTTLLNEFTAAGGQGQFYDYLKTKYGAAMDITSAELQMLQKGCTNCRYLLAKPVKLPVFLDPPAKGCITASEYAAAKTALNTRMGTSFNPTAQNYETIFVNYLNGRFGFTLSYGGYLAYEKELTTHPDALLCNRPVYSTQQPDQYQCMMDVLEDAVIAGRTSYRTYIEEIKRQFRKDYIAYCGANRPKVLLTTRQQIYHYTLYYYDQAGNLIRTVPPEGVHLLDDGLTGQVDLMRNSTPSTCSYNGQTVSADKNEAFQKLTPLFTTTNYQSMEMWLSSANGGQVTATLPGKNIMFNACLAGPFLNFDVYNIIPSSDGKDADIVLTGHTVADMRAMLPLQLWTHVVIQGPGLNQGGLSVYVNGKRCPVGPLSEITPCLWEMNTATAGLAVPENLTALKHLRLYNRLLTANEVAANAAESCMDISPAYAAALQPVRTYWGRFNIPVAGAPGTIGGTTTETRYTPVYPEHTLTTSYVYQSLNKVEAQNSPDGGTNRFWYDRLGRVVASQNAEQKTPIAVGGIVGRYSYNIYDGQNRVIEIGEKSKGTTDLAMVPFLSADEVTDFLSVGYKYSPAYTHYDVPAATQAQIGPLQTNLRNRISWVESSSRLGSGPAATSVKTYYSYDQIGNVKSLWQYVPFVGFNTPKRIDYKYDLVSGKVDKLRYQVGEADQFLYAYEYDAENRVTKASSGTKTTAPGGWEILDPHTDASYRYYLHGPLARTELGDKQLVQGIDYAYTLQGWLKGVNGNFLQADRDMGLDGFKGPERPNIGRDAYAYTLDYYNGDYKSIGGTDAIAFRLNWLAGQKTEVGSDLFNGNISRTMVALKRVNEPTPVGYSYRYDQLNRLKAMRQHLINIAAQTWRAGTAQKVFMEDVTYDGNGNILTYGRNGSKAAASSTVKDMDDLSYVYARDAAGNLLSNRLQQVDDKVTTSPYASDLKNGQSAGNYVYDNIGNLLSDGQEQIDKIGWNYSSKITSIRSIDPANQYTVNYLYDASGNRAMKIFKVGLSPTGVGTPTIYIRDAQGNVLAMYDYVSATPRWKEQYLYGSNRLGSWNPEMLMVAGASSDADWSKKGNRIYELTNHLGNVLATISDKRMDSVIGGVVDHYEAEILSAQDYYPFGMLQPDRQWRLNTYRYGFNGKENDNEVKGEGNQQDYGMRVYDPRLAKFLSVDPLTKDYPWYTPYQFAGNTPVQATDLDGEEEYHYTLSRDKEGKAVIKLNSVVYENEHNFLGIKFSTPITKERAVVTWGEFTYKIGFSGIEGTGNDDAMPLFKAWKDSEDKDLGVFANSFHTEQEAVGMHNDNAVDAAKRRLISALVLGYVLNPDGTNHMLGSKGSQTPSKTLWKGQGKERIDVENPNPGQRPGQIHYQDINNKKYVYNVNDNKFYSQNPSTGAWDVAAPKAVSKLLENKDFQKGIDKGLRYLGEKTKFGN